MVYDETAFELGYSSFTDGTPCPYEFDTNEQKNWLQGYEYAMYKNS